MLNVGGSIPRQGPFVRGLTIAFNMSGQQTTFVQRLVLLIWRSRGGLEGCAGGWWSKLRGERGGGQNQTCFITRAVMGSPHTPRPPQVPRESPITLFLPLLKFAAFAQKKNTARRKKMSEYFFLARNDFFSAEYFFLVRNIFLAEKKYFFYKK